MKYKRVAQSALEAKPICTNVWDILVGNSQTCGTYALLKILSRNIRLAEIIDPENLDSCEVE